MDLKERIQRHSKDYRWIIGVLSALLVFLGTLFYLLQRGRGIPSALAGNKLLLFALWYVDVVLILAILFVLIRNVVKLLVERKSRILGSKFKTKLMATYIGLSLIPVLLLFFIGTEFLQSSIDRWFNTPLDTVLQEGRDVALALRGRLEREGAVAADRALTALAELDLRDPAERPAVARRLQELLPELGVGFLGVYEGTNFVHAAVDPREGISDLPEPTRTLLAEAATEGEAIQSEINSGGRLVLTARARLPAGPRESPADGEEPPPPTVVVVGSRISPELTAQMDRLIQAYQSHLQIQVQKSDIRTLHLLIFLMATLVILFTSSWVGLYLARRITVPIQALAEGTRRISGGDLGHRVRVSGEDELGVLVDSFNEMTRELQRSRRGLVAANERLDEERALIAAVLENVAAGVLSIDSDGRIFTCNGAALLMLQQTEEQVLEQTVQEAWSDPERGKLARLIGKHAKAVGASEELHLIIGGTWRTFEAKITAMLDADGKTTGRVVVLEDLTELIEAQQLAAWSEAARRIAHEIKNPLTPIRLAAERMLRKQREDAADLETAIEDGVETIVREVDSMGGMVDEFSRYARMPRPRPVDVDLSRLFEETLHLYRDLKPGVEIRSEVSAAASLVRIDPEQFKRALINLLDNAIQATDSPGVVTVAAARLNGRLEIRIADTGEGIPARQREKLFLPHFSTKGRGTGLGLAIVHRIVTDHKGTVRVEENRPHGTVFTIELPLR